MAMLKTGSPFASVASALPSQVQHGSQSAHTRSSVRFSRQGNLRWANGDGFGLATQAVFVRPSIKRSVDGPSRKRRTYHVSAFTPEQSKLVKDSWSLLQKNNPGEHALKFFLKVFEIAPSVKRMFSFLRDTDVPVEKNPQLKVHALTVLSTTGQAATQLGQKGALDSLMPKLMELGHSHVTYGVVDEHFDVVKYALLATLAEALPDKWSPEMKEAWGTAYDEIVKEILKKMRAERAELHSVG